MESKQGLIKNHLSLAQLGVILALFYWSHYYNYLLFHSLAELFTVIVAFGIFIIVWNSRKFIDNNYFLVVGISFLLIGVVDLLHTLAYKDFGVFPANDANLPTQLWIMGRYVEAVSLVIAPLFIDKKKRPNLLFAAYFVLIWILLASIFAFNIFPASYVEGSGLTLFKIVSEYIIAALLILAIILLFRKKAKFEKIVWQLLLLGIALKIFSEIMFTLYVSVFSSANLLGHLFKVSSFYFFYVGIIKIALTRPYQVLFKNLKDSEISLKESEQRYRSLVEYSPNAIFLHVHGVISYINPAGLKLFGAQRAEQIVGKRVLNFIDEPYRRFVGSRSESIYMGSKFMPMAEVKIITLSGQTIEVEASDSLINLRGKLAGQTVMSDITQRKKIEKQLLARANKIENFANDLRKFKLAVENASDSIIITGPDLKIIYANRTAEKMTGYRKKEMVGRTLFLWHDRQKSPREESDILAYCRQTIKLGSKNFNFTQEVINKRKSGENYIAVLNISPVSDEIGRVLFFVLIERDITKLKKIDRAKTEFVSLASHQLRTPLASVSLSAELLLRGVSGPVEESQIKYLKEIYKASRRMKNLIEALLNVTRIELGTFVVNPETINLTEEIDKILKEEEIQLKLKKLNFIKIYADDLPPVQFDKNILDMTIDNLMANAIRYTPAGGKIILRVKKEFSRIIISLTDTGCGIPKNQQPKIFEKLFRADNAKSINSEGAGLGLYMTRSLLKRIGGKIWFNSNEDQGAAFFVSIPLRNLSDNQRHEWFE